VDTVHVRALSLRSAADDVVFQIAIAQERVLVLADTDFGTMLTLRKAACPSVILLLRTTTDRWPAEERSAVYQVIDPAGGGHKPINWRIVIICPR
jgi:hypothetical protein